MKLHPILIVCLVLTAFALPSPAQVDVNPAAPSEATDAVRPQISCNTNEPVPISIKAPVYEGYGSTIRYSGGLVFTRGKTRLTASEGEYDFKALTGRMKNVSFTTCPRLRPDYHLTASEVTLLPNNRLRARGASLYLGSFRVLALPMIKMRVGGRNASAAVFPRPGFDKRDGVTLSQNFRVIDEDNLRTNADLRLTSLHGIQGQVETYYALNGNLDELPGRYLSYDSLRSRATSLPRELAEGCILLRPVPGGQ